MWPKSCKVIIDGMCRLRPVLLFKFWLKVRANHTKLLQAYVMACKYTLASGGLLLLFQRRTRIVLLRFANGDQIRSKGWCCYAFGIMYPVIDAGAKRVLKIEFYLLLLVSKVSVLSSGQTILLPQPWLRGLRSEKLQTTYLMLSRWTLCER